MGRAIGLGVVMAWMNVALISIVISIAEREGIVFLIAVFSVVPATILGAFLGIVARVSRRAPKWLRVAMLTVPAILLVFALGGEFAMRQYITMASIPTIIAALALERVTREAAVSPPLPVAQTRVG